MDKQPQQPKIMLPGLAAQSFEQIDWQYWSNRTGVDVATLQQRYVNACREGYLAAEMAKVANGRQ